MSLPLPFFSPLLLKSLKLFYFFKAHSVRFFFCWMYECLYVKYFYKLRFSNRVEGIRKTGSWHCQYFSGEVANVRRESFMSVVPKNKQVNVAALQSVTVKFASVLSVPISHFVNSASASPLILPLGSFPRYRLYSPGPSSGTLSCWLECLDPRVRITPFNETP